MKKGRKLKISNAFKKAIRKFSEGNGMAQYKIATEANVSPCILSYMLNDSMLFYSDDPRIQRIAEIVGFRRNCFAKEL